jgi:hypothetical protein
MVLEADLAQGAKTDRTSAAQLKCEQFVQVGAKFKRGGDLAE